MEERIRPLPSEHYLGPRRRHRRSRGAGTLRGWEHALVQADRATPSEPVSPHERADRRDDFVRRLFRQEVPARLELVSLLLPHGGYPQVELAFAKGCVLAPPNRLKSSPAVGKLSVHAFRS